MAARFSSRSARLSALRGVVLALGLSVTFPAAAQPAQRDAPEVVGEGATYAVRFVDDPLHALNDGTLIPRIRVRLSASRVTLIRPRTQFVTEMLKSAEAF